VDVRLPAQQRNGTLPNTAYSNVLTAELSIRRIDHLAQETLLDRRVAAGASMAQGRGWCMRPSLASIGARRDGQLRVAAL